MDPGASNLLILARFTFYAQSTFRACWDGAI